MAKTKYREEYCEQLIKHMSDGFTFESFAGRILVDRDTLYEWEKHHVEFSDAKRKGRDAQLLYDEKLLNDLSNGTLHMGKASTHIFKMKNCHRWKDNSTIEIKPHTGIDLSKLTDEQLEAITAILGASEAD